MIDNLDQKIETVAETIAPTETSRGHIKEVKNRPFKHTSPYKLNRSKSKFSATTSTKHFVLFVLSFRRKEFCRRSRKGNPTRSLPTKSVARRMSPFASNWNWLLNARSAQGKRRASVSHNGCQDQNLCVKS